MKVFRIEKKDVGKVFTIKPLSNVKNVNKSIISYKTHFSNYYYEWVYNYMSYVFIDDEVKILSYDDNIWRIITKEMMFMSGKTAIQITPKLKGDKLVIGYKIVPFIKFDNDRIGYVTDTILNSDLDLQGAVDRDKNSISRLVVKIPIRFSAGYETKTMKEIYEYEN